MRRTVRDAARSQRRTFHAIEKRVRHAQLLKVQLPGSQPISSKGDASACAPARHRVRLHRASRARVGRPPRQHFKTVCARAGLRMAAAYGFSGVSADLFPGAEPGGQQTASVSVCWDVKDERATVISDLRPARKDLRDRSQQT